MVDSNHLRSMFAASMAEMYGTEVGLYKDLVRITEESNEAYLANRRKVLIASGTPEHRVETSLEEEIGPLDRVKGERHGAIRLGSPKELAEMVRIYKVLGMSPVGFYNLGATGGAAPVISTAGRPKDLDKPNINPFRLFTSVLDVEAMDWDKLTATKRETLVKKFGTEARAKSEVARIQNRMREIIPQRAIFPKSLNSNERVADLSKSELGELVATAEKRELNEQEAEKFVALITKIFAMSPCMAISLKDYKDFRLLHEVAADILAFPNPHINHLTPRALDIADAYDRMEREGQDRHFRMLKKVQGPAEALRPVVLLKQTSYISKPTWVYMNHENPAVVPWLKKAELALASAGVKIKYEGQLDLAKFGLALDNEGLNLKVLFGDEKLADFTLGQLHDALRKRFPAISLPACPDRNLVIVAHTARFGEIEQRAIALTPEGRSIYDRTLDKANAAYKSYLETFPESERSKHDNNEEYQKIAGPIFASSALANQVGQKPESQLVKGNLAYYIYHPVAGIDIGAHKTLIRKVVKQLEKSDGDNYPAIMQPLVDKGLVSRRPVVYEDFLPKSAAGIFKGNQRLAEGQESENASAVTKPASSDEKLKRFTDLGVPIYVQYNLFAAQQAQSIQHVMSRFQQKDILSYDELKKSSSKLKDIVEQRDATMEYKAPIEEKGSAMVPSLPIKRKETKEADSNKGWKIAATVAATLAVVGGIQALFLLSVALPITIPVTVVSLLLLAGVVEKIWKEPAEKEVVMKSMVKPKIDSDQQVRSESKGKCLSWSCDKGDEQIQTNVHNGAARRNLSLDGRERLH